jgi:Eco57I restriction-modification methylase
MTPRSREAKLLAAANAVVASHVTGVSKAMRPEARFQLLEGVASRVGGFDLLAYWRQFGTTPVKSLDTCLKAARHVIEAIEQSGIPPALAVSALARETLETSDRRTAGAYHTDFRLAQHLARRLTPRLTPGARVIDPACGAGMLLAALMSEACGADRRLAAEWLAWGVNAADISSQALRGCLLSLACLTDDLHALVQMRARWFLGDSLLCSADTWGAMAPKGFDAVIANPPWEKVKLTRHEYLKATGEARHYGADYAPFDPKAYGMHQGAAKLYARTIAGVHTSAAAGETDLFVAFTELSNKLLRPGGEASLLVPAGLIRSKSTEPVRRKIVTAAAHLSIEVFENRARFFEIDTRFKFLCVHWRKRTAREKRAPIELAHGYGTDSGVQITPRVQIGRVTLSRLRPDLSLPEVRDDREWQLFCRMMEIGADWSRPDSPWYPAFSREVDMTRDRPHFSRRREKGALPVVEGRMVHQHRFGAKIHLGGTGRSALWQPRLPGGSVVRSQFFIRRDALSEGTRRRVGKLRAGFCDITGQTNERSCLAAVIPRGVVCGNKVPTLLFPNDPREDRLWLWIAIANSLPFDWLLRRVITTTVNYFHLLSLRLPAIEPESLPGRQLVEIARTLAQLDGGGVSVEGLRKTAELRARADRIVLTGYGLADEDLQIMLADFPLIDRLQPAIEGEGQSTVTRDLLFSYARNPKRAANAQRRLLLASERGAIAYLASQFVASGEVDGGEAVNG